MAILHMPDATTTEQRFREWLIKIVDQNGDGRISRGELREALRALGRSSTWWKSWRAMKHADLNRNNFIDGDMEIEELMRYASKWGIVINPTTATATARKKR
ncbi:Calcium-binding protein CML24 [Apostasia shenzhenica]|uniref:Calcium-binding protein CML24 n=1 Tax=Apostasia shenzhenica TaxID=1088818 RepID=A0A2I0BCW3_9ASPA|nr:Calcium-binding protein CML24 [Apostasia shenzhenica]